MTNGKDDDNSIRHLEFVIPFRERCARSDAPYREDQSSTAASSSAFGEVPLYSWSLLRRVRMLTSRSFAAWVRLPLHFSSAARMWRFSISASEGRASIEDDDEDEVEDEVDDGLTAAAGAAEAVRPRCSGSKMPLSPQRITARSMTFCNSRTLPGQLWVLSARMASSEKPLTGTPCLRLKRRMNSSLRNGTSSRRSRNGGTWIGTTFRRKYRSWRNSF